MAWYNVSWAYRVKVTVLAAKVDADLTDYPVYVSLTNLPSHFHTYCNQTDARDIRVTTSDETTEVPREVVFYASGSDAGELHFKASGTLSGSADTDFYIYYGNAGATEPAASDTYGSQNAWNSGYKAVYHFKDGTTLSVADSTASANNGTNSGGTAVAGTVDGGLALDGSSSVSLGTDSSLNFERTDSLSIESWVKRTSTDTADTVVARGVAAADNYRGWQLLGDDGTYNAQGIWIDFVSNLFTPNWLRVSAPAAISSTAKHLVVTYDGSSTPGGCKCYVNGANITCTSQQNSLSATIQTSQAAKIGTYADGGNLFDGTLDELRISNVARAIEWASTCYNNQSSPSTFYTIGPVTDQTSVSNSGYQTADGSYTFNHTCAGSDRYLVVSLAVFIPEVAFANASGPAVTYNGVAMTRLAIEVSTGGTIRVEKWGLIAPATGTNTVAIELEETNADSIAFAASFTGRHQTIPTEALNDATNTTGDVSVDITTVADLAIVIDSVCTLDTSIALGAGQVQLGNVSGALGSGAQSIEGPKTPAGSVTMSWTGNSSEWVTVGIALRPVGAASGFVKLVSPGGLAGVGGILVGRGGLAG